MFSIKFDSGDVIIPPILDARPIQGEKEQKEMNQQHTKKLETEQQLTIKEPSKPTSMTAKTIGKKVMITIKTIGQNLKMLTVTRTNG